MKVKNIAFSGFAAAILSGVGAANAAVQIVSPDYVTKAIANKQDTLTAGTGIDITGNVVSADMENATVNIDGVDVSVSTALAGAASDAADAKSDAAEAVAAAEGAAAAAQTATATASTAKATAEGAAAAAQTATETANTAKTTADEAKTAAGNAVAAVASKANASDVYTKGETDGFLRGKQDAFTLGTNLELVDGVLNTKGIATDATFTELEGEVDDLKTQVGEGSVATRISDALTEAKGYTDTEIGKLSNVYAAKEYEGRVQTLETTVADLENYDDTEVRGSISANAQNIATNTQNIATNTQDIATIKTAGYIPAPDGNGMWLANVQGENVSWEAVEILSQP
ncbi:MAG: hypothetical protein R8M37_00315 [Alphaproteobacteria bacterium]|nr:hypothetical protein [Alphaproteobacteria bacterium]